MLVAPIMMVFFFVVSVVAVSAGYYAFIESTSRFVDTLSLSLYVVGGFVSLYSAVMLLAYAAGYVQ